MPRPSIKIGGAAKKATPRKPKASQEASVVELAEQAVETYEQERQLLEEMQQEFEEKFSDAAEFLQNIKIQEDTVMDAIASAKSLVSQSGQTVGDFLCKRKYSKPRYNDESFTKLIGENADGETVIELVQGGHVKKIVLADSATAWFASHPGAAEAYQSAWEEKKELTAAVTVPKLK